MLEVESFFQKALTWDFVNTSYPLKKETWLPYKKEQIDLFSKENNLSLYIHIPFCDSLCSFCEYVKYQKNSLLESKYLDILTKDIDTFLANHKIDKLYGFDIGGGTPTALDMPNFKRLMAIAQKINQDYNYVIDYVPSIEATFKTIDEEKIALIKETGFKRISLGIQTINPNILLSNNRNIVNFTRIKEIVTKIKEVGLRVNLDLMYGIPNQKLTDINDTIKLIQEIKPTEVTLYEMRYNMVKIKNKFTKEELLEFYNVFYNNLIKLGYKASFGQNTFSLNDDLGLSSYLKYRMIDNISYKGFGISAQSKSAMGLSYNLGKNGHTLEDILNNNSFIEEDIYLLPKEELLAKYIAISLYYGQFKISIMQDILKEDPFKVFAQEFAFLLNNQYITINDDIVSVTKKGFKYYGAIGAMFFSKETKKLIMGVK